MESTLVRRDQFNITPQGIVHKPTAAAFTPYPGDPYSGNTRTGQLSNKHPNGIGFSAEDVERMMRELWVEYVTGNPTQFKTAELGCAEAGPPNLDWSNPQAETPRTGVLLLMETPKVTAHTTMLQPKRGGSFYSSNANRRNGTPGALRFATLAAGNSSTTPCGANDEGTGVTQAQTVREKLAPYPGNSFCIENCGPLF